MKLSINRNTIWCDLFIQRLVTLGVQYACVSPGSRSTPLTIALASNSSIETFPIVDERSSAFFALGLAKKSNTPVVVVTTSGTAVAELHAAIIEAYYQRVPLIICTADRPSSLINSGANQTINQHNIYKNHIRYFADAGLPEIKKLKNVVSLAEEAVKQSNFLNRGPVHINFPFEKPFEPDNYTDKINIESIDKLFSKVSLEIKPGKQIKINFEKLTRKFIKEERGLILVGYANYPKGFTNAVFKLSKIFGYPVYADGASPMRFGSSQKHNLVENFTAFIRSQNFQNEFDPKIIIQFGGAPTGNVVLEFFKNSNAEKIIVNDFGDRNDPSLTAKNILACSPLEFCHSIIHSADNFKRGKNFWLENYNTANRIAETSKQRFINNSFFPFEGRIISELINALPNKCNLMISNSLPVRDTDFFAACSKKEINIYTNRGASGIDGINSTAIGIAKASNEPTYLLIGDLAFYHDMNGLLNSLKFKIPLTIILVDNSGGGIFESLPISSYRELMEKTFLTPLNLDFEPFVHAYGGIFNRIKNWREFHRKLLSSVRNKTLTVLHLKTDAVKSKLQRQLYWAHTVQEIDKHINEIRNRRH